MVSMLISFLILGLLILVHEAGHFFVARLSGVRVERFSIGFGPQLFSWKRGHTVYALSAIPLGGYVKMAGEQEGEAKRRPYEFLSKSIGTRAGIIFAGPLVNYLTAILSLWIVFIVGFPELDPTVGRLIEDMPAQAVGLTEGDRILAIDGTEVSSWNAMTEIIHDSADRSIELTIDREGARQTIAIVPKEIETTDLYGRPITVGQIGIGPGGDVTPLRVGPVEAIKRTFSTHGKWTKSMGIALSSIVTGRMSMRESLTGPIGIIMLTSEALTLGITTLLYLVSLFSLSLAIFNVLPIPILDGGHLLWLGLEKLKGTPVSLNVQEVCSKISFALLLTLIVTVCVYDIQRYELWQKLVDLVQ